MFASIVQTDRGEAVAPVSVKNAACIDVCAAEMVRVESMRDRRAVSALPFRSIDRRSKSQSRQGWL